MAINPRYDVLFEPVKIGPVTAPNRFYCTPHALGTGNQMPYTVTDHWPVLSSGMAAAVPAIATREFRKRRTRNGRIVKAIYGESMTINRTAHISVSCRTLHHVTETSNAYATSSAARERLIRSTYCWHCRRLRAQMLAYQTEKLHDGHSFANHLPIAHIKLALRERNRRVCLLTFVSL